MLTTCSGIALVTVVPYYAGIEFSGGVPYGYIYLAAPMVLALVFDAFFIFGGKIWVRLKLKIDGDGFSYKAIPFHFRWKRVEFSEIVEIGIRRPEGGTRVGTFNVGKGGAAEVFGFTNREMLVIEKASAKKIWIGVPEQRDLLGALLAARNRCEKT